MKAGAADFVEKPIATDFDITQQTVENQRAAIGIAGIAGRTRLVTRIAG
jgi:FixJ family two-component response regulator